MKSSMKMMKLSSLIANQDKSWTAQDFLRFLTEVQKEKDADLATVTKSSKK
jgi:hypothetical protein